MNRFAKFISIISLGFAVGTPITASAAETIGEYYAALGAQDYRSSNGGALGNFAAVLQQDRANYHRFGKRDPQDQGDPFFGKRALRAKIPALFAAGDNGWWVEQPLVQPTSRPSDAEVFVVICGTGGQPTHLIVNHANGDGYTMCEGPIRAGD